MVLNARRIDLDESKKGMILLAIEESAQAACKE
jgi:hypothetical protein